MHRPRTLSPMFLLAVLLASTSVFAGDFVRSQRPAPGTYFVIMKETVSTPSDVAAEALIRSAGGAIRAVYHHVLHGVAADMSESAAIALSNNPLVDAVIEDSVVTISSGGPIPVYTPVIVARYLQNHPGASKDAVINFLYSEASTGNGVLVNNNDGRMLPVANISDCN